MGGSTRSSDADLCAMLTFVLCGWREAVLRYCLKDSELMLCCFLLFTETRAGSGADWSSGPRPRFGGEGLLWITVLRCLSSFGKQALKLIRPSLALSFLSNIFSFFLQHWLDPTKTVKHQIKSKKFENPEALSTCDSRFQFCSWSTFHTSLPRQTFPA